MSTTRVRPRLFLVVLPLVACLWSLVGALPATAAPLAPVSVDMSHRYIYGMQWQRHAVERGFERTVDRVSAHPLISVRHQLVIVAQGEGDVIAYRLRDGGEVWRKRTGIPWAEGASLISGPTVAESKASAAATLLPVASEWLLLSSRDGSLSLLSSVDGRERWRVDLGTESRAPATHVRGRVLVTTVDGSVLALEATTGEKLWQTSRAKVSGLTIDGHARAVYDRGVVYCAFADGYVGALRFADGSELWMRPISVYGGEVDRDTFFADADADPVIVGQTVFVASYADGVLALERATGKAIWRRPMVSVVSLAHYGDTIVALGADGFISALDRKTGERVFRTTFPPASPSRLHVVDHLAVFSAGDNGLLVIDLRRGQPLQATGLGSPASGEVGISADGRQLAVITEAGRLYALRGGAPGLVR